jgi:hypothetical protein
MPIKTMKVIQLKDYEQSVNKLYLKLIFNILAIKK